MHKAKQAVEEKQCFFPSLKDSAFQDYSVIVLSDNESESDSEEDENNCRNNAKARKRCLETQAEEKLTVQYSLRSSKKSLNQGETILRPHPCKKRKMDATVLLDSSCMVVSDTEDAEITTVEIDDEIDNEIVDENIGKETDENVGKETNDGNIGKETDVSKLLWNYIAIILYCNINFYSVTWFCQSRSGRYCCSVVVDKNIFAD